MFFEEKHFSAPDNITPLGAQSLQRTGYYPENDNHSSGLILMKLLSNQAKTPTLSTTTSIGLDLYSANENDITIE